MCFSVFLENEPGGEKQVRHDGAQGMQGVGAGGARSQARGARGKVVCLGTGREREGCCGQQHEGGRAHPIDPGTMHSRVEYHRHATQGDSATVGLV